MPFGAIAGGLAAGIGGSLVSGLVGGGDGGGGSAPVQTQSNGSIGQGIGDILAGGLSAALGIQGLAGGNLNQLQAGAAAANPFGSQAGQYSGILSSLFSQLPGGLFSSIYGGNTNQGNFFNSIIPTATINTGAQNLPTNINTNINALLGGSTVSTPGQTSQLQGLLNNPTQLIQTLQGGGVQLPSGIQSILGQNPYQLTSGEQFQEQQGLTNLNRSLAQTGQLGSGNQYAAAEQYGQQFASQATQQNITNLLGAQATANQTAGTNQGLQALVNNMGQNQFGNTMNLAQLLTGQQTASFGQQLSAQQLQSGQQQNTASNTLAQQQLMSSQQQNTQVNLQNLLQSLMGIGNSQTSALENLLPSLLTTSQASLSSPATAGGILANLGVANQSSGGNIASGLAGLGQGLGSALQGVSFGSGGSAATGSFSGGDFSGAFTSDPYYSGGGNSFGFTM